MKEAEIAGLFNSELDAFLLGGKEPVFSPDPGAMEMAGELARADFSCDSLIRESLRGRLVGATPRCFTESLHALFANTYARAALAAAALFVAFLPLFHRMSPRSAEVPAPARPALLRFSSAQPAARGLVPGLSYAPRSAVTQAGGLFVSLPMGRLETEPIKYFPIVTAGCRIPIGLSKGREVNPGKHSVIMPETGGDILIIKRRVVSLEDIFERRLI